MRVGVGVGVAVGVVECGLYATGRRFSMILSKYTVSGEKLYHFIFGSITLPNAGLFFIFSLSNLE